MNVPIQASDDYVVQLARLWKDGDTIDGFTNPGLDATLNLYVVFSNEAWNPTFDLGARIMLWLSPKCALETRS